MNKNDRRQIFSMVALVSNIGLQLTGAIFVGVKGGQAVDERLGSYPLATFGGALLGVVTGMWGIYRHIANKL